MAVAEDVKRLVDGAELEPHEAARGAASGRIGRAVHQGLGARLGHARLEANVLLQGLGEKLPEVLLGQQRRPAQRGKHQDAHGEGERTTVLDHPGDNAQLQRLDNLHRVGLTT
jgi:hypothetical protein